MGEYESISKSCAVNGRALSQVSSFLKDLVSIQKCCEFNHSQMKAAYMNLAKEKPNVSTGKFVSKVWSGLRAERVTTVLSHVRRVCRSDDRVFQMLGKMDAKDYDKLRDEVLQCVELSPTQVPSEAEGVEASDVEHTTRTVPSEPPGPAVPSPRPASEAPSDLPSPVKPTSRRSSKTSPHKFQQKKITEVTPDSIRDKPAISGDDLRAQLGVDTPSKRENTKEPGTTEKIAKCSATAPGATPKVFDPNTQSLGLMYYKRDNCWAIRIQGGPQIVSVSKRGRSKEDLERLAKRAKCSLESAGVQRSCR